MRTILSSCQGQKLLYGKMCMVILVTSLARPRIVTHPFVTELSGTQIGTTKFTCKRLTH